MLTLSNLSYTLPAMTMAISFAMNTGERLTILGPSGAGKSTLLSLIAGFLPVQGGRLILAGQDHTATPPSRRPLSMLFQENNLFPHLSVAQNIGLGLAPRLRLNSQQQQIIQQIAERVGLQHCLTRRPAELSGGQRQRAALARCLVRQQPILLLDEPFSALDPALRQGMLQLVDEVCRERNITLLMVSHRIEDARQIAPRTLLIVDGKIRRDGPADDLFYGTVPEAAILGITVKS